MLCLSVVDDFWFHLLRIQYRCTYNRQLSQSIAYLYTTCKQAITSQQTTGHIAASVHVQCEVF